MMRMVPHLCFPQAGNPEITLPVDVGEMLCKVGSHLVIDSLVDTLAVWQAFLEMDECSVTVKPLIQGNCTYLPNNTDSEAAEGELIEVVDGKEDRILLMGEHGVAVLTALPLAPLDQKPFYFLPVIAGYGFYRSCTVALEFVHLAADGAVIFSRKFCKIRSAVNILKIIPVRNQVDPGAGLLYPSGDIGVNQHERLVVAYIGCKPDERPEECRVVGTYWGAEPGNTADSAGNDDIFFNIGIRVMGVMIPADHVREGIIAVSLRVQLVMPGEKIPVGKRDGHKIIRAQHQSCPRKMSGTRLSMGQKPSGR